MDFFSFCTAWYLCLWILLLLHISFLRQVFKSKTKFCIQSQQIQQECAVKLSIIRQLLVLMPQISQMGICLHISFSSQHSKGAIGILEVSTIAGGRNPSLPFRETQNRRQTPQKHPSNIWCECLLYLPNEESNMLSICSFLSLSQLVLQVSKFKCIIP